MQGEEGGGLQGDFQGCLTRRQGTRPMAGWFWEGPQVTCMGKLLCEVRRLAASPTESSAPQN